jgi:hypothetical protein
MMYQMYSQVVSEDARREAKKFRLVKIARQASKAQGKQQREKLVSRFIAALAI